MTTETEEQAVEPKPLNIHQKMLEVMKKVEYLRKDDKVEFKNTSYKGLSEEKVTSTVRQAFVELGLVMYPIHQTSTRVGNLTTIDVTYRLVNADGGDYVDIVSTGEGADSQDKAAGKAMTYAYKYALLRSFAIASGEDTDKVHSAKLDEELKKKANEAHANIIKLMDQYIALRETGSREKLYEFLKIEPETNDINMLNYVIGKLNEMVKGARKDATA